MTAVERDTLLREPLTDLAARLRRRELSAVELVRATLDHVDRLNPRLNAIVTLRRDEVLIDARLADERLASGKPPRPLEGIPFTVKDLLLTAGLRTTAGSLILRDYVPAWTAPAVQRLREAGAILLGKSNCAEFGMGNLHTGNRLFGDAWNPWDLSRTPGGSSGGDSAAVAAGLSCFGIGTDYGGSVRWPAHCTGVASLRPTPGLVPTTGVLPHGGLASQPEPPNSASFQCWIQTIGPIARSARDLPALLAVMAGPDPYDPHTVRARPMDPFAVDLSCLHCAWFEDDGTVPVRADVRSAVQEAALALRSRGLRVEAIRPPGFERAAAVYEALRSGDGLVDHAAVAAGRENELTTVVRESLEQVEGPVSLEAYRGRAAAADAVRAQVLAFMEDWPILILPVGSEPAFTPEPAEFLADRTAVRRSSLEACCRAVSLLRAPAAVVPCGTSAEGLPIGIQVVGRPFHDDEALVVALALETELGRWSPP